MYVILLWRPVHYLQIKTSSSESWPRKVELNACAFKIATTTVSILHITSKTVFVSAKTSFMAVVLISKWCLLDHN